MERATAIGFVRELHRAQGAFYSGGSADRLRELLAPDVAWHVPGASPIAGDHVGVDAVLDYMTRRRDRSQATFRMHTRDVLAGDGDEFAALTDGTAMIAGRARRGRRSGSTASARTGSRPAGCSRSTRWSSTRSGARGRDPDLRPRPRQPDRRAHGLQRRARAPVRDRPRRHRRGRAARGRHDPRRGARPRRARRLRAARPAPGRGLARLRARHGRRARGRSGCRCARRA